MKQNEKINWLHSLRGIACIIVVAAHIVASVPGIGIYASGCGKIGVWFFMVVSGFFLIYPYLQRARQWNWSVIPEYYERRLNKIYPVFLIALAWGGAIQYYSFRDIVNVLLLRLSGGIGHFWYMIVIIKFYIIAPFFIFVLAFMKKYVFERNYKIFLGIILVVMGFCFSFVYPYTQYSENSTLLRWYVPVFVMGGLLAVIPCKKFESRENSSDIKKNGRYLKKIKWDLMVVFAVGGIVIQTPMMREQILGIKPNNYLQNKYLDIAFLWCLIIFGLQRSEFLKKKLSCVRCFQKIGDCSYEIYLFHYIFLQKFCIVFPENVCLRNVLTIIFTALSSFLVHYGMEWIRGRISARAFTKWIVCIGVLCFFVCWFNDREEINGDLDRLYVPTMITKVNSDYFIVDCWQHRVLYSEVLSKDLRDWKQLTDDSYIGGHTVCSDGKIIVLDNTDNSQLLVYKKENGRYDKVQTIYNVKGRPHYVSYDERYKLFYVIASTDAKVYVYKNEGNYLKFKTINRISQIENSYVRSLSVIDGKIYTVSGPQRIHQFSVDKNGQMKFEMSYVVPDAFAGMNQIVKIEDYYYITVNTDISGSVSNATILRVTDLGDLEKGKYDELYNQFGFEGQPYFITNFDGRYYITEISAERGNGIKSFQVSKNDIRDIHTLFYWDDVTQKSKDIYHDGESRSSGEKELIDLFIFSGQSNMSGKGDAEDAVSAVKGYEFRVISSPDILYGVREKVMEMQTCQSRSITKCWISFFHL